jgi:archaemetzincin
MQPPCSHAKSETIVSVLQRAFSTEGYEPLPQPGPHDWLANHVEPGQTFERFIDSRAHKPDRSRRTIYFQPLENFSKPAPPLRMLENWAAAFFTLPVRILAPQRGVYGLITTRQNPFTGDRQLLTRDILSILRQSLPSDAFCVIAITMNDLYPDPLWNFVFGQASLNERVGVYSFARYLLGAEEDLILRRSCKVLAHETSHMFGIEHCVFFRCLMNGSNHLAESDVRPMHYCPVDLRKLHDSVGFDMVERYQKLEEFSRAAGFADEADWVRRQVRKLTAD